MPKWGHFPAGVIPGRSTKPLTPKDPLVDMGGSLSVRGPTQIEVFLLVPFETQGAHFLGVLLLRLSGRDR